MIFMFKIYLTKKCLIKKITEKRSILSLNSILYVEITILKSTYPLSSTLVASSAAKADSARGFTTGDVEAALCALDAGELLSKGFRPLSIIFLCIKASFPLATAALRLDLVGTAPSHGRGGFAGK